MYIILFYYFGWLNKVFLTNIAKISQMIFKTPKQILFQLFRSNCMWGCEIITCGSLLNTFDACNIFSARPVSKMDPKLKPDDPFQMGDDTFGYND